MNVLGIALRSLRHRTLSTALTAFGVALGVALSLAVSTGVGAAKSAFFDAARGYDVVISGPRTTGMTAVMSAVFHRDNPRDRVPRSEYDAVAETAGKPGSMVKHAVPCAVGDFYRGFRVVGTTSEFFDAIPDAKNRPLKERVVAGGRVFGDSPSEAKSFVAVVGSFVAARTGLAPGSTFRVVHGTEDGHEHKEVWTVIGILEPTGTPNDQAIFITLGSFFEVGGHEKPIGGKPDGDVKPAGSNDAAMGGGPEPGQDNGTATAADPPAMAGDAGHEEHEEDCDCGHDHAHLGAGVWAVSTVVVRLSAPILAGRFVEQWNAAHTESRASMVRPEIHALFSIVAGLEGLLRSVSALVLLVAGLSILSALYNSILGRRREIAILRALGARRAHVFSVVMLEALLVCLLGGAVGIGLGHLAVAASAPYLLEQFGVRIVVGFASASVYTSILLGLAAIGLLAGALPAWRAYRVPVAKNLHPID